MSEIPETGPYAIMNRLADYEGRILSVAEKSAAQNERLLAKVAEQAATIASLEERLRRINTALDKLEEEEC